MRDLTLLLNSAIQYTSSACNVHLEWLSSRCRTCSLSSTSCSDRILQRRWHGRGIKAKDKEYSKSKQDQEEAQQAQQSMQQEDQGKTIQEEDDDR